MTADVLLRPASSSELDALGALKLRASLAHGDHVTELAALPEARQLAAHLLARTLVADVDGVAVGFVTVAPSGDAHEIEELFVEPSLWRSGYGRLLVKQALSLSKAEGATTVRVVASRRAQAFYARCGFAAVGEVMTQFEPAPVMERRVR